MPVINTPNKNYSVKYPIILDISTGLIFMEIQIDIIYDNNLIYTSRIYPFSSTASANLYRIDIAPIIESSSNYLSLGGDLAALKYNGNYKTVTINVTETVAGGQSIQQIFQINKAREDFYSYYQLQSTLAGYILPDNYNITGTVKCYVTSIPSNKASVVLAYDVSDTLTSFDVEWQFKGSFTQNETITFTASPGHYNLGLDEIIKFSTVITNQTQRDQLTGYNITNTAGWDLQVDIIRLDHCKFEPISFIYPNKYGFWDTLNLPVVRRNKSMIEKEIYRKLSAKFGQNVNTDFFNSMELLERVYKYGYKNGFTVSSDWVGDEEEERLKYMATADVVYVKEMIGSSFYLLPVNIIGREIQFRNRKRDKIYNLQIEAQFQSLNQ